MKIVFCELKNNPIVNDTINGDVIDFKLTTAKFLLSNERSNSDFYSATTSSDLVTLRASTMNQQGDSVLLLYLAKFEVVQQICKQLGSNQIIIFT